MPFVKRAPVIQPVHIPAVHRIKKICLLLQFTEWPDSSSREILADQRIAGIHVLRKHGSGHDQVQKTAASSRQQRCDMPECALQVTDMLKHADGKYQIVAGLTQLHRACRCKIPLKQFHPAAAKWMSGILHMLANIVCLYLAGCNTGHFNSRVVFQQVGFQGTKTATDTEYPLMISIVKTHGCPQLIR